MGQAGEREGELRHQVGDRIGPYELLRPLGTGAFASLWLARRADGAFERIVGLKVPRYAPLRPAEERVFERDRDILAALEHPAIARLYDAGSDALGRPYLAMESVVGLPITSWCDARSLDIRSRLQVFVQALDAVAYAHERGIAHGELGSDVIVVSGGGQVRVLDFGLLKLAGAREHPGAANEPALMAEAASPVADLAALGGVLWEVLCGARPGAGLPQPGPGACITAEAAAARSTPRAQLVRELRGDLDAIARRALDRNPLSRYPSVAELALDVKRYLGGERVRARADTALYRIARLARRYRHSLAIVVAGAVVAALAMGLIDPRRADPTTERMRARAAMAGPLQPAGSIAVLPFDDLSEAGDQQYFTDGLSEELIDRLSRAPGLRVIARTSSFRYRGARLDTRQIGEELGVAHLLEGSVRRSGNLVRVSAQLVRAADGANLWSQTYERPLADVFRTQDEIASNVAQSLRLALQAPRAAPAPAADSEAYNQLLRGDYYLAHGGKANTEKAIGFYREAVRLEPDFARAWAKLAMAGVRQAGYGWETRSGVAASARDAARRALASDPQLSLAHQAMGAVLRDLDWDWEGARREYRRALELEPQSALVQARLADLDSNLGKDYDAEIVWLREVVARNPLDSNSLLYFGDVLCEAGRLEEAMEVDRRLIRLSPDYAGAQGNLAEVLLFQGHPQDALEAVNREPDENWRLTVRAIILWTMGRKAASDADLRRLESLDPGVVAYNVAEVYAWRGDRDAAFRWLALAVRERDPDLRELRIEVLFHNLHGDPRFDSFLRRLNLPELEKKTADNDRIPAPIPSMDVKGHSGTDQPEK